MAFIYEKLGFKGKILVFTTKYSYQEQMSQLPPINITFSLLTI